MKSTSCVRQTLAVTAALCAVFVCSAQSFALPVYVDPTLAGTATDDSQTVGIDQGFDGTYRIGDVTEVEETESQMWIKFLLPSPSPGATSIQSANLILGLFDHSESGSSPGLSAGPATDQVNGGDGDFWTSGTIHNALLTVDGTKLVNYFNDDVAPPGTPTSLSVTSWFSLGTGEGLGEMLTVRLMGGSGYSPMMGDGWMVLGGGASGTAPVASPNFPAIRLELTLVPEPSTAALGMFAAVGFGYVRRKLRQ